MVVTVVWSDGASSEYSSVVDGPEIFQASTCSVWTRLCQTSREVNGFCHLCLFGTGGDFGFDEGEEHSLSSFQARDLEFRRLWFLSHLPLHTGSNPLAPRRIDDPYANRLGNTIVTEDDVEYEFWRLVQSPNETVEVEYGADVHSTTHGRYVVTYRMYMRIHRPVICL